MTISIEPQAGAGPGRVEHAFDVIRCTPWKAT